MTNFIREVEYIYLYLIPLTSLEKNNYLIVS